MTQRRNENISAGARHVYGSGFQVSAYQLIMSRQMSVSRHKTALAQDAGELEIPLSRTKSQQRTVVAATWKKEMTFDDLLELCTTVASVSAGKKRGTFTRRCLF